MKRLLLILPFIFTWLLYCDKPRVQAKAEAEKKPAIIFLGDSLTAGYGLPLSQSYPSIIKKKLEAENLNYSVINAGVSGDTTSAGLARLPWYLKIKIRPKILVIALGSNDGMRGIAVSEIRKNLKAMIQQTRAFDKNIKILLVALRTLPNMGPTYGNSYKRVFEQVARTEKVPLLPFLLLGVAGQKSLNQTDGIHPTAKGTEIVAENIWRGLKPHL